MAKLIEEIKAQISRIDKEKVKIKDRLPKYHSVTSEMSHKI